MNCKPIRLLYATVLILSAVFYVPGSAQAKRENHGILIIYTTIDGKKSSHVKMLDLLAGHFTSHVTVKKDADVTSSDLEGKERVIYFGQTKRKLSKELVSLISGFQKQVVAIGFNAGQISQFSGLSLTRKENVYQVRSSTEKNEASLETGLDVLDVSGLKGKALYTHKSNDGTSHPFIWKTEQSNVYIGLTNLQNNYLFVAKRVREAFGEPAGSTLLYLRLEDISPMSDEKLLLEAGTYLHKRHIPFILAVIPVYLNPKTGDKVYLADKPKLVKTLRKLQNMGGSVVVHGYTHAYRYSETGEGFEFWDAEADQPITSQNAEDSPSILQKEQDFPNETAYHNYLKPFRKNEETYTRKKLTHAIEDLTAEGLYPLAFEAPHYTMSEQGYQIASQYFSSIIGQVQLSDATWKTSGTGPFVTKPAMLHGMTLYPETLGYVDASDQNPLGSIEEHTSQMIDFEGGVAGAFYHPYLGMTYLPELVDQMERIPNSRWLDLKKTKQTVKTDKVEIHTNGNGTIQVNSKVNAVEKFFDHHQQSPLEKALWILSAVVLLFVVMFVSYTLYLRATLKKRIFKERKSRG
ncbi:MULTISPECIES: DUF2334 domain-containing protein [Bacillus]|uniref:DUF2334 domain-containing protein n=1 Tax=Bacillus sonorensis TaxID=119858 RepID=A0ABN5AT68_9BACI|nr:MULTISPECIES: DUF2334 domain-containing protein [Bacillus]ASB91430.1 uncharacterized protein S101395_04947 [Bacillus sonorensis]MBG9914733.1 hypothetical protein [Bacillus sonorensis]MCF7615966.1 DUF2334 domain-containing protein [Bacillus sonorensis]MCY8269787.1 DUF2334 domain-containing protein [Bacillus sonorensis]MCY8604300.1 DUF2334 domain-containing protein [Bacillus sonorensis]